jgi:hypothetical protein
MRRTQMIKDNLQKNQSSCRLLFERLNERDQRHVAGLLALAIGHDGISFVGDLAGLNRDTVSQGKKELLDNLTDVPKDRIRKPGAGRPSLEKKVPKSFKNSKKSSPKKPVARLRANGNSSG